MVTTEGPREAGTWETPLKTCAKPYLTFGVRT